MKLPKAERRDQLLAVAMTIVREEGADALTLGTLATRAGVSRPIAYDHFSTRPRLLLALFQQLEDRYIQSLRTALAAVPGRLYSVADVMSSAYFGCHAEMGPEGQSVSAALKGNAEMARRQQAMIDEYVDLMRDALRPFASVDDERLHLICTGLLGAAEAMAREVHAGRSSTAAATSAWSSLIVRSVAKPSS